jgi:hypothetical protein
VEPNRAAIHTTPCAFRQVWWSFPTTECVCCGGLAPRLWDASRVAVDIDLDQPIVLTVVVSVHVCPVCGRMFERFHRASNVSGQIAGTGIGLATAHQVVEQHGGSLEVESEEGRGSTFTVRLPLAPDTGRLPDERLPTSEGTLARPEPDSGQMPGQGLDMGDGLP